MKFLVHSFLFFVLLSTATFAQDGPGGVGNSTTLSFWVRADNGTSSIVDSQQISFWNDGSGNGNDLSQATSNRQPTYRTNIINGYPAIQFDNSTTHNDYLTAIDAPNLDGTTGLTIFSVVRPSNSGGAARSIVSKRNDVDVNHSYMFFLYTNNYLFTDVVGTNNRFDSSPAVFPANGNYLFTMIYNGNLASSQRSRIHIAEGKPKIRTEASGSIPDNNSPLVVGATHTTDNRPFAGYMAEIIIYHQALDSTQRIIVNNYLSAKYSISLSRNDVYRMDEDAFGNYDHEVTGIGRTSSTDLQTDSRGTSVVRILNATGLNDGEYYLWGHDNGVFRNNGLTDLPSGIEGRVTRVWRGSETGDVGNVDIEFDLTGLGPVTAGDLRLLVDTNNLSLFADEVDGVGIISGATHQGGNIYRFSSVNRLNDAIRFTLGSINTVQTPLPVVWSMVNAELVDGEVTIDWSTSSEKNNSHFTVQRSDDGVNWVDLGTVTGEGTTQVPQQYNFTDESPLTGLSYYRIAQTDYDGKIQYSKIVSLSNESSSENIIKVYPNPTFHSVVIDGVEINPEEILIINTLGQNVTRQVPLERESPNRVILNLSTFTAGMYSICVRNQSFLIIKR